MLIFAPTADLKETEVVPKDQVAFRSCFVPHILSAGAG
jgi:hypothetical protein